MKEEVESLRDDFKPHYGSAFKTHVSFEKESQDSHKWDRSYNQRSG